MENLATIRPGDKVKLVDCLEATYHENEVYTILEEARKIGSTWCVKINDYGWFDVGCIQKITG